jgi:hypothetical protein
MSKELSRTFDTKLGAVIVNVEDNFGNVGVHTVYVAGVENVDTAIADVLTATDVATTAIAAKFAAAGWVQSAG